MIGFRRTVAAAAVAAACTFAGGTAQPAAAVDGVIAPAHQRVAGFTGGELLREELRQLFELPLDVNPFNGAGDRCLFEQPRRRVLIAWWTFTEPTTCTVQQGTPVFFFATFGECSSVEDVAFSRAQQRCAIDAALTFKDFDHILVSVDGRPPVDIAKDRYFAVSPPGSARLPADNLFEVDPQPITFAAAAWMATVRPLRLGRHTIQIEYTGERPRRPAPIVVDVVPRGTL